MLEIIKKKKKSWLVFDFEKLTLLNIKLGVLQFGHKSTERLKN